MKADEIAEEIAEFETEILGITCMNGSPVGIVFFRDGKLLGAELGTEQMEKIPTYTNRRDRIVTTINAPAGITAKVSGMRVTRRLHQGLPDIQGDRRHLYGRPHRI